MFSECFRICTVSRGHQHLRPEVDRAELFAAFAFSFIDERVHCCLVAFSSERITPSGHSPARRETLTVEITPVQQKTANTNVGVFSALRRRVVLRMGSRRPRRAILVQVFLRFAACRMVGDNFGVSGKRMVTGEESVWRHTWGSTVCDWTPCVVVDARAYSRNLSGKYFFGNVGCLPPRGRFDKNKNS